MYYKSIRIIDGKPKWVIVDENDQIVDKSPTKEQLKTVVLYNKERLKTEGYVCCISKNHKTYVGPNGYEQWYDCKCGKKDCTKRLCKNCWKKIDYDKRPDSDVNIKKSLADRRIHNLRPNSEQAKGDMFEELTCIWRGVENLNVENDDYGSPIDHSRDSELGIVQTQSRLYDPISGNWTYNWKRERHKEFDNLICYCASKDGKYIDRIYIFPKKEIINRTGVTIVKNPSRGGGGWYEQYRVKDEDVLKTVNDIWGDIIKEKEKKKNDIICNFKI